MYPIVAYKAQHFEINKCEVDGCKFYGIRIAISKSGLIQNTKISYIQLEAIECGNN